MLNEQDTHNLAWGQASWGMRRRRHAADQRQEEQLESGHGAAAQRATQVRLRNAGSVLKKGRKRLYLRRDWLTFHGATIGAFSFHAFTLQNMTQQIFL